MKNSQIILTVIALLIFAWAEYAALHSTTTYGTTVQVFVSTGDEISISGADTVSISAQDDSYFRIYAGESRLIAQPDENDQFFASDDSFSAKDWQIKEGRYVDVTLKSDNLIVVHKVFSDRTKYETTIIFFIATLFFWILALSIFTRD